MDFAKELKSMEYEVIPIVIFTCGTIPKGLVRGLEELEIGDQMETILTTALLRLARILKRLAVTLIPVIYYLLTLV